GALCRIGKYQSTNKWNDSAFHIAELCTRRSHLGKPRVTIMIRRALIVRIAPHSPIVTYPSGEPFGEVVIQVKGSLEGEGCWDYGLGGDSGAYGQGDVACHAAVVRVK